MRPLRLFSRSLTLSPLVLAAFALSACGGEAPPAQAPPPPPAAAPPAMPTYDLSAVPDPPGLLVTGHVTQLSKSLATAHAWTK
ncbi:MAG TPA: hypothetical protein VIY73_13860, partial [Polyangiaceae bacterium]